VTVIDPASSPHETLIGYDSLSRRVTMTDPDTGLWTFHYDLNGNIRTREEQ
jgi:YD repeat-containing protein